jgi:RNA polymerase sigma factor (sigma-70 family)
MLWSLFLHHKKTTNNYTMRDQTSNVKMGILSESTEQDAHLFTEFQSGNANAFSHIYSLYINALFSYGCKLTSDRELLKDCIHDVFVKLYMRKNELGEINSFKSYLFISLRNKLCDEMRKRTYMSDVPVESFANISDEEDVETSYIVRETKLKSKNKIGNIMEKLSPRQREALALYYLEEKKYDDICEIMNMNYQSVRNLMHRGLVKLRTMVG